MNREMWKKADWTFFASVLVLILMGLLLIFTSSRGIVSGDTLIIKTIFFIIIGFVLMFIFGSIDYLQYIEWEKILYAITIVMLVAVLIFGIEVNGSKSWFSLGGFLSLQPAEFSKVLMILCLGSYFNRNHDKMNTWTGIFKAFLYILPPLILILLQPDTGTAMVYIAIVFGMLFASNANKKHVAILLFSGLGFLVLIISLYVIFEVKIPLASHQLERFVVFLDPYNDGANGLGAGYNIIKAMMAIGSGGFWGKGFQQGTQTPSIPEHQTDFAFAVIGEEFGFFGAIILILVYFFFLFKMLSVAHDCLNHYGFVTVIGFFSMFLFHIVENIGMNIGLMPITGIPLPFISYGGSSLWTGMIACGIVLSVSMRRGMY